MNETSYLEMLKMKMETIKTLLSTKLLPVARQRAILKQLTAILNVLEHEPATQKHVITEAFRVSEEKLNRTMKPVKQQYHQFKKKQRRITVVSTNVKSFKTNEGNRHA